MGDDPQADDDDGFTRRRRANTGDLDITPMIDVTFLLLIFFMVTSTMKPPATADVPPARHGTGADAGGAVVISVTKAGGDAAAEPLVLLPDAPAPLPLSQVRDTDAIAVLLRTGLTATPPRDRVLLNADRDLPHGAVREVSAMIGKVEGVRLFLGVQDK